MDKHMIKQEYDRLHYIKNKEKRREQNRLKYLDSQWKENMLEKRKLHYQKNKERILQERKIHYNKHTDRIKEYQRGYGKSDKGRKNHIILHWKYQGILCFDYELLYSYYIKQTTCEFCEKDFKNSQDRCLDHNHDINDGFNVRGVICRSCNSKDVYKIP